MKKLLDRLTGMAIGIGVTLLVYLFFLYSKVEWTWKIDTGDLFNLLLVVFVSLYFPGLLSKKMYHYKHKRSHFDSSLNKISQQIVKLEDMVESHCTNDLIEHETKITLLATNIRRLGNLIKSLSTYNASYHTIEQELINALYQSYLNDFKDKLTEWTTISFGSDYLGLFDSEMEKIKQKLTEIRIAMNEI